MVETGGESSKQELNSVLLCGYAPVQFDITPAKLVTSVGVRRLPSLLEIITLKCVLEALFVRLTTILPIHDYSAVERRLERSEYGDR